MLPNLGREYVERIDETGVLLYDIILLIYIFGVDQLQSNDNMLRPLLSRDLVPQAPPQSHDQFH